MINTFEILEKQAKNKPKMNQMNDRIDIKYPEFYFKKKEYDSDEEKDKKSKGKSFK